MSSPPDEPLMSSVDAASVLGIDPATLERMTLSRLVTPTATDPDGIPCWRPTDLRDQLTAYLDDHPEDQP
jgi:hypothetical protein